MACARDSAIRNPLPAHSQRLRFSPGEVPDHGPNGEEDKAEDGVNDFDGHRRFHVVRVCGLSVSGDDFHLALVLIDDLPYRHHLLSQLLRDP